jgi:hypothetical protein
MKKKLSNWLLWKSLQPPLAVDFHTLISQETASLPFFLRLPVQSRTQSNACARARKALALGKYTFPCAVIGLTFINSSCWQTTGTPKFRGSSCLFPQSQCLPSLRTGIALGTRLLPVWKIWPITPPPPPEEWGPFCIRCTSTFEVVISFVFASWIINENYTKNT